MNREPVILGGADGLVIVLGLLVSLTRTPGALWHAALGAGLAELVGMSAGVWLSRDNEHGLAAALWCGVAACAGCVAPALPYLALKGSAALSASLALVLLVGALVAWLRPEHGRKAVAQTFGVLLAASMLCYFVGLL